MEATAQSTVPENIPPPESIPDYLMQDPIPSQVKVDNPIQTKVNLIDIDDEPIPEEKKQTILEAKTEDTVINPNDHFLDNCKKIIRYGLFKTGIRYFKTLLVCFILIYRHKLTLTS